jgi:hypothetical protein
MLKGRVEHSRFGFMVVPGRGPLKAASIVGFLMFFLALRGLCPYSARRARLVLFEAGRRACSINSEEENETRWQNQ